MMVGDLFISDADGEPPPKIKLALAVIGAFLHPTFDRYYQEGASLDSCVLVSLVLRDFLFRIGFTDAEYRSVSFLATHRKADETTNSLLIGKPGIPDAEGRWNGHMVAVLPKAGWLFDCTLYQTQIPQWEFMPGMVAAPIIDLGKAPDGRKIITGFDAAMGEEIIGGTWIDTPGNKGWRTIPDFQRRGNRERHRRAVADVLVRYFENAALKSGVAA